MSVLWINQYVVQQIGYQCFKLFLWVQPLDQESQMSELLLLCFNLAFMLSLKSVRYICRFSNFATSNKEDANQSWEILSHIRCQHSKATFPLIVIVAIKNSCSKKSSSKSFTVFNNMAPYERKQRGVLKKKTFDFSLTLPPIGLNNYQSQTL